MRTDNSGSTESNFAGTLRPSRQSLMRWPLKVFAPGTDLMFTRRTTDLLGGAPAAAYNLVKRFANCSLVTRYPAAGYLVVRVGATVVVGSTVEAEKRFEQASDNRSTEVLKAVTEVCSFAD